MRKRKTYQDRVEALCEKAKDEIRRLLNEHEVRYFDIPDGVYVLSQVPGAEFTFCRVSWVGFVNEGYGDVLCFDYEGGIAWYQNPIVWCQICDALRRTLK